MSRRQLRDRYPFHNQPLQPLPPPRKIKPPRKSWFGRFIAWLVA